MEPSSKLFPAIFVEATSKEILQIELGRTSTTLPLSAAVLQNSDRHVTPQVGALYMKPVMPQRSLHLFTIYSLDTATFESPMLETTSMGACSKYILTSTCSKIIRYSGLEYAMRRSGIDVSFTHSRRRSLYRYFGVD